VTISAPATGRARFLAALHRQAADATPVWFMRQAGRCLPSYRKLRERHGILEIAKTPELATKVGLMPVEQLGVDGCVLFADIMLPLEGMGVSLEIQPEVGPIIHQPIRTMADVDRLRVVDPAESTPYVLETIRNLRRELGDRAAVIGFSGAPFTLACYLIEGRPSREYLEAKRLMFGQPEVWDALLGKVADQMARYLRAQAEAGADVLQVFDSWVGALGPDDYRQRVLPHSRRVLRNQPVPTIHFGTGTASLLELMAEAGGDLLSVDWRMSLDDAWTRIGPQRGIQGNLDGARAVAGWEPAREGAREVLRRAGGRPGHIFNLGHGVMPETDPDVLKRLVDFVHQETAR
jgi:uroporphyrinogen decarboxylase